LGAAERRLLAAEGNGTTVTADTPDAVVAKDGSGQYKTIGEALKMVPKKSVKRYVVYVKKGEYVENIDLDKNTWNVMIRGDGMTETVVTGSRNYIDGTPTFETATFGKFFNLCSLFSICILFIFYNVLFVYIFIIICIQK
jgi:pectinesterase